MRTDVTKEEVCTALGMSPQFAECITLDSFVDPQAYRITFDDSATLTVQDLNALSALFGTFGVRAFYERLGEDVLSADPVATFAIEVT